jgi:PST family polysaccharide transporter
LVTLFVAPLYGLIAYQVLVSALLLIITAFGTDLLRAPRFHRDCYREMAREGWWSTSVRFVAANVVNLDQIIVASIAGSTPLAYFNLGKRIETSFVSVANSFVSVSFQPLFARFATVPPADVMRRSLAVLTVVCAVPAACLLADGPLLVRLIFGRQWMPAVAIAQVLAVSGVVRAIGCVPGALLSVSGRNRQLFIIAVASAVATALAALLLTPFGSVWCAVGLLIKNALSVVWLAAGQRDVVPRAWRVYIGSAIIPFALVVAGTFGVVEVASHVFGTAAVAAVAALVVGSAFGSGLSLAYLAAYLHLDPRRLLTLIRGPLTGDSVAPPAL